MEYTCLSDESYSNIFRSSFDVTAVYIMIVMSFYPLKRNEINIIQTNTYVR